jgi:hypothetical protein
VIRRQDKEGYRKPRNLTDRKRAAYSKLKYNESTLQPTVKEGILDAVPRRQSFLNHRWEYPNLRAPTNRIVLLEANKELLEHVVQLCRRLVPTNNRIAEPKKTLHQKKHA